MTPTDPLSCAIKNVASTQKTTFATTQAVWRFLNNECLALARQGIASSPHSYVLLVHDWSRLPFHSHHKKHDRQKMTHGGDIGYELQSSPLVAADTGLPVAPLAQTLTNDLSDSQTHMDALTADVTREEAPGIGKTRIRLIDRGGDTVAHMRALRAQGLRWHIRGKRVIKSHIRAVRTKWVRSRLTWHSGPVNRLIIVRGQACLSVAETPVILTRVEKPKRTDKATGRRVKVQAGPPLAVRLVVARLSDSGGSELGRWTLLTNVDVKISAEEIAQWYCWR
jgi:hypothetical protein